MDSTDPATDRAKPPRRHRRGPLVLLALALAGAALLIVAGPRVGPDNPSSRSIFLSRNEQAQIAADMAQAGERPPTAAEVERAIAAWVREEVLYREALRRGLDKGKSASRETLTAEMEAIFVRDAAALGVDDATLEEWMREHPRRFASDVFLTFDQVSFDSRGRAEVGRTLIGGGADWMRVGDGADASARFQRAGRAVVTAAFGEDFGQAVERLEPGPDWQGPIKAKAGWHLVRFEASETGPLPPLDTVRGAVETDWRKASAEARATAAYETLRSGYTVHIER